MKVIESVSELNERTAYKKNHPIYEPKDMHKQLKWTTISDEWKKYLIENHKWWAKDYPNPFDLFPSQIHKHIKQLLALRDKLLLFGGNEVCLPSHDEDIGKILSRGQFWYGDKTMFIKGEPCQCHLNSVVLWDKNRNNPYSKIHIATGYALSNDGMWRQHTWLISEGKEDNEIIETTVPRIGYFGFVMTENEAESFSYWYL